MDKLIIDEVLTKLLHKYMNNTKYTITQGFSHYLIEIPSSKGYLVALEMRKTRNSVQYIVKADGVEYTGSHKIPEDTSIVGNMLTSISNMVQTMLIDIDSHVNLTKATQNDSNTSKIITSLFENLTDLPHQITVITINNTKNIQVKRNNTTPEVINIILDGSTIMYNSINKVHQQQENKYDTYSNKIVRTILERGGWL